MLHYRTLVPGRTDGAMNEFWPVFWVAVGSLGAWVAAVAAAIAVRFTYLLMRSGQAQVTISQGQFAQSVTAQQNLSLPVLIPISTLQSVPSLEHSEVAPFWHSETYLPDVNYATVS